VRPAAGGGDRGYSGGGILDCVFDFQAISCYNGGSTGTGEKARAREEYIRHYTSAYSAGE
ncbi:MAG TPA: hypothetical protein VFH60_02965, partial [Chloroflexia bacterium]|nr:hypothetical protein [Chloroflexia bacterium]